MPLPDNLWLLDSSSVGMLSSIEARAAAPSGPGAGYGVQQGIALIHCCGLMLKSTDGWWSPVGLVSTSALRQQFRQAAADPAIKGVLFIVSSGGGQSDGTLELADDIRATAAKKPVFSFAQDAAASAAYWAASQAHCLFASPLAKLGSIGAYQVVIDSANAAAKAGVTVHLVKSGPHKGAGYPGTNVTPEHLANIQMIVDRVHQTFVAGVAAGRRMSANTVQAAADGRVYLPDQAAKLKLIDGVSTLDATFAALYHQVNQVTAAGASPGGNRSSLPQKENPTMTATEQFNDLVEQAMKRNGGNRMAAVSGVSRQNPQLHALYLAEVNEAAGRHVVAGQLRDKAAALA